MGIESMILHEGGLKVTMQPSEVTFFDLLYFSRTSTSRDGGWNSKSHWVDLGLNPMASLAPTALENWTEQSLEGPFCPEIRPDDFRFSRSMSDERKAAADRAIPISDADETALNSAIFQHRRSLFKLQNREVTLHGYEIPLTAESEGQLKVDLLGHSGERAVNTEVVELKKAKNTADSPLMAFIEVICYGIQIVRLLRSDSKFRAEFPMEAGMGSATLSPRAINLTILAPSGYWNYWGNGQFPVPADPARMERFQTILSRVNDGLEETDPDLNLSFETVEPWMVKARDFP